MIKFTHPDDAPEDHEWEELDGDPVKWLYKDRKGHLLWLTSDEDEFWTGADGDSIICDTPKNITLYGFKSGDFWVFGEESDPVSDTHKIIIDITDLISLPEKN